MYNFTLIFIVFVLYAVFLILQLHSKKYVKDTQVIVLLCVVWTALILSFLCYLCQWPDIHKYMLSYYVPNYYVNLNMSYNK
jgi:hypothetical protein